VVGDFVGAELIRAPSKCKVCLGCITRTILWQIGGLAM
jgi:hypothetical protein